MEVDDDVLGSAFGLGNVLAQVGVGVDSAALSAFLERSGEGGGGSSSRELAAAIEEDDEDKFMDDVSEASLPDENPEDKEARRREQAAIKAEEARWARRAAAEIAGLKNEGDIEREARKKRQREERERNLVFSVWPDFKQGVPLKMSEVFYDTPAARSAFSAAALKKKRRLLTGLPHEECKSLVVFGLSADTAVAVTVAKDKTAPPETTFLLPSLPPLPSSDPRQPNYLTPIGSYFDPQWVKAGRELRREEMTRPPRPAVRFEEPAVNGSGRGSEEQVGRMLDLADWENDIILFSGDYTPANMHDPLQPRNDALETDDWQNEVIWDARRVTPDLVEDHEDEEAAAEVAEDDSTVDDKPAPLPKLDPFNISNDHFYEHTRASRFRIRQTFGAIEVFHSTPAKVLQMPFVSGIARLNLTLQYKTTLGKNEARSWHRPVLSFPSNVWLSFSKLKSNPSSSSRKNKTLTDPSELFKTTKDLSLTEKGPFVLLEFSVSTCAISSSNYG